MPNKENEKEKNGGADDNAGANTLEERVKSFEEKLEAVSKRNEELKASVEGLQADNVKLREENNRLAEAYKEHFTKSSKEEAEKDEGLKKEVVSIFEAIVKAN